MQPLFYPRLVSWLPFVASALLVSFAIHLTLGDPALGAAMGVLALAILLPQHLARRRLRRLLMGGDVEAILSVWQHSLDRVPHPETMVPLLRATALAAHGMIEAARGALGQAARGWAWHAAVEQRLFIETLLHTFDGDREQALQKAAALQLLPLPIAGPFVRARIAALRGSMQALARAFARTPSDGDLDKLEHAARTNPLVHWPMRYAAAVVCIEGGDYAHARRLLRNAPSWPEQSVFNAYQTELSRILEAQPA
jgi:hypothetical protein